MTVTMHHGRVVRDGSDCGVPTYPVGDESTGPATELVPDLPAAILTAYRLADRMNRRAAHALWSAQVTCPDLFWARAREAAIEAEAAWMEGQQLTAEMLAQDGGTR